MGHVFLWETFSIIFEFLKDDKYFYSGFFFSNDRDHPLFSYICSTICLSVCLLALEPLTKRKTTQSWNLVHTIHQTISTKWFLVFCKKKSLRPAQIEQLLRHDDFSTSYGQPFFRKSYRRGHKLRKTAVQWGREFLHIFLIAMFFLFDVTIYRITKR